MSEPNNQAKLSLKYLRFYKLELKFMLRSQVLTSYILGISSGFEEREFFHM